MALIKETRQWTAPRIPLIHPIHRFHRIRRWLCHVAAATGTRMVMQRRAMQGSQFLAQRLPAGLRLRKEVVAVLHPVVQSLVVAEVYGCQTRSRFCWDRLPV